MIGRKRYESIGGVPGDEISDEDAEIRSAFPDSGLFARSGISINSTSTRAALTGMSAAGKSGTTTANNDVWFVGYTPYYTAGIWGGCDSNQKLSNGNGGTSFHKDIWRNIMNRVHNGMSDPGPLYVHKLHSLYNQQEKIERG